MPTLKLITSEEDTNSGFIHLHKEGSFWKAYERSAYLLCTQVRQLKVRQRVVKSLAGRVVVSVGFPVAHQERTLPASLAVVTSSDTLLTVAASAPFDAEGYDAWRRSLSAAASNEAPTPATVIADDAVSRSEAFVVDALRHFDLAHSTPLDTMDFVNRLQQLLLPR